MSHARQLVALIDSGKPIVGWGQFSSLECIHSEPHKLSAASTSSSNLCSNPRRITEYPHAAVTSQVVYLKAIIGRDALTLVGGDIVAKSAEVGWPRDSKENIRQVRGDNP